ncbi:F-box family protein [Artemisia annua]|uniref:F-box family protein n=1 Tax=Artemisia annua TaxID=35608 RepID=A0A2U1L823_ARTAN|nr:F-box family protein [Artemisia annua]
MVNTRGKIRKTQHTRKTLFSQTSITESDHQSTDSGALVGSNEELLTEILLRLPVTSVLRFKSVSKHWLSLLSHRHFTKLYDKNSNSPGLFVRGLYVPFDVENKRTPPIRKLDFVYDLKGLRIVQSCNGLLLCCSDLGHQRARKYYVFNPTTKQFAIIPSVPGGTDVRKTIRFMGLAYNKEDCVHYKVLCIRRAKSNGVWFQNGDQDLFQIQIYSSDTGKWKILNDSFSTDYYTSFYSGVYWNGAIHWAPSCLDPLYFKLDVEHLEKLPLPPPLPGRVASFEGYFNEDTPIYFGESRGHLHMVLTAHDESYLHLIVYEMSSDHSGWFIKYQVDLDELPDVYPEMIQCSYLDRSSRHYYEFEVLDVVRGENEENSTFMVVRIPGKIIRYNVFDKSFNQIYDLRKVFYGYIGNSEVHRYTEAITYF